FSFTPPSLPMFYPLSLHDALPIYMSSMIDLLSDADSGSLFLLPVTDEIAPNYSATIKTPMCTSMLRQKLFAFAYDKIDAFKYDRSEEHTSELQSRGHLVCRLLLEK